MCVWLCLGGWISGRVHEWMYVGFRVLKKKKLRVWFRVDSFFGCCCVFPLPLWVVLLSRPSLFGVVLRPPLLPPSSSFGVGLLSSPPPSVAISAQAYPVVTGSGLSRVLDDIAMSKDLSRLKKALSFGAVDLALGDAPVL